MIATGSNAVATASHKEKKPSRLWRKGLISLEFLAPRPGLEPGTYGLTVFRSRRMPNTIRFSKLPKLLIFLQFFHLGDFEHSMRFWRFV